MKHLFFTIVVFIFLFSCSDSEEIIDTKENSIENIQTRGFDNGKPTDPAILDRMDLRASLELASYIAGRTILKHEDARNYIVALSLENNVLDVSTLIGRAAENPFKEKFHFEFLRLFSRPGVEDGGVEPIGFRASLGNILDVEDEFRIDHYQEYLIFLAELNCLELFFPVPLSFNKDNMRITVTMPRLSGNEQSNIGGELYQTGITKINAGHHLLVDTDYLFSLAHTDNNLLILRPVRTIDEQCEYPTNIYTNTDFNDFLNF